MSVNEHTGLVLGPSPVRRTPAGLSNKGRGGVWGHSSSLRDPTDPLAAIVALTDGGGRIPLPGDVQPGPGLKEGVLGGWSQATADDLP